MTLYMDKLDEALKKLYDYTINYGVIKFKIYNPNTNTRYYRIKPKYSKWFYRDENGDEKSIHNDELKDKLADREWDNPMVLTIEYDKLRVKTDLRISSGNYKITNWTLDSIEPMNIYTKSDDYILSYLIQQMLYETFHSINENEIYKKFNFTEKAKRLIKKLNLSNYYFDRSKGTIVFQSELEMLRQNGTRFKVMTHYEDKFELQLVDHSNESNSNSYRALKELDETVGLENINKFHLNFILDDVYGSQNFRYDFERSKANHLKDNNYVIKGKIFNFCDILNILFKPIIKYHKRVKKRIYNYNYRRWSIFRNWFKLFHKFYMNWLIDSIIENKPIVILKNRQRQYGWGNPSLSNIERIVMVNGEKRIKKLNYISDFLHAIHQKRINTIKLLGNLFSPFYKLHVEMEKKRGEYLQNHANHICVICNKKEIHPLDLNKSEIFRMKYNTDKIGKYSQIPSIEMHFMCCRCYDAFITLQKHGEKEITLQSIRQLSLSDAELYNYHHQYY